MARRLLILGGSSFVGRALASEGLMMGFEVTTFNRGLTGSPVPGVATEHGDRRDPESLRQLADRRWDLVVDTWAGAPSAVKASAQALSDHAGFYAYISSESVYAPPPPLGADEAAETVRGDLDAEQGDYPELKRGAEIAVEQTFGDRMLLARAGTILGPHENTGRLTWWLSRMARGGEVLCPGPRENAIQYIDARDLARFVITAATTGYNGAFNTVSRKGHATMRLLLETCRAVSGADDVVLTWLDPEAIATAGIEPWEELPIYLPPGHEYAGMHDANVERAHAAGLHCRPLIETVSDTWQWQTTHDNDNPNQTELPQRGLDPRRERDALAAWHSRTT
jgi:nucleoside-diphosphate-sugar epimerase